MAARTSTLLFATLFREEWRLHASLFGGRRFLAFPALLAVLVAGGAVGLSTTGTDDATVLAGLHALVFAFGLYSGTAGFVGSDALEGALGEYSLVLSSATTLPVSRRHLLGVFLVKDAVYYACWFVAPMAVGTAPLLGRSATTAVAVGWLWCSLSAVFVAGMVVTVVAISARTRGVRGSAIGLLAGGATLALWWSDGFRDVWDAFVGRGEWIGPLPANGALGPGTATLDGAAGSAPSVAGVGLASLVLGAVAVRCYDPTWGRPSRTATERFGHVRWVRSIVDDEDGLITKTLLDLGRSSGGFAKPLVSAGVLLALVAVLVGIVREITGTAPAPGIFFGGVLGLSAFTTYNWLTQFDGVEEYLAYPVDVEAIFRAKRTAFVLVGAPSVALPYLAAALWFDATPLDALVGALVLAGYSLYYYGLTVFLAGFDPNEFLFDAARFAAFALGVAVALVPTLVAGFVVVPPSPSVALALGLSAVAVGGIGLFLSKRAASRWAATYRDR